MTKHSELLNRISRAAFMKESEAIAAMLPTLKPLAKHETNIDATTREHVQRLREHGMGVSVEAFLQEYSLSSKEGVAIMCLAEALLRIPDRTTANALIDATFSGSDWEKHLGSSDSLLVNASSWGLLLTGKTLSLGEIITGNPTDMLSDLLGRSSRPIIRQALKSAMRLVASQFVMGETTSDALAKATSFEKKGYRFSYDMLGEGARSQAQADSYLASYHAAIDAVADQCDHTQDLFDRPSVSIKLTALHPRYEWRNHDRVIQELVPSLCGLIAHAQERGICVAIDAEEAARLDIELDIFHSIFTHPEFANFNGIGFVLQSYQKRAFYVIDYLLTLTKQTGKIMPIRLVKGAYWDTEIKHAQIMGLPSYPVFTTKAHSDVSYLACAKKLLDHADQFFPQFATHNAHTITAIDAMASDYSPRPAYEFQRLYGMGEKLYEPIVTHTPCRVYAPIGEHKDLLAYLIRRLLENGANSSFVHIMMNKDIAIDDVVENPITIAKSTGGKRNVMLPLPADLYGTDRQNSSGYDLGYRAATTALTKQILASTPKAITPPTHHSIEDAKEAIEAAHNAFGKWNARPVSARAEALIKAADLLSDAAIEAEAIAILQQEAGKTIDDAIGEVRETIDFLRYYAAQAQELFQPKTLASPTGEHNSLALTGRGVFVCIAPWNFPLAIFTGQLAAALISGNCVIAKPAEQTSYIGQWMTQLLYQAGIPKNILQCICGAGSSVGSALTSHRHTAGVAFTGSTATAKRIHQSLANKPGPITPLIAETGGQNCMIVDSSALIEQAVDDAVHSAFGSAGQRCSALRVLYVHNDIADKLITLLAGAMDELSVGDATALATDIGPVIDDSAHAMLTEHQNYLATLAKNNKATHVSTCALTATRDANGKPYFAPMAYEIQHISQLSDEVFGPILHIIRYKNGELEQIIADINSTGYGLTFGIHSRIPESYQSIANAVNAGNVYINREMTGAVVGVQPFGGMGLSGTGPKAGGPHYLLRFVNERTTSINTAAIGGNIELLVK